MTTAAVYELIGYLGSALVVVSLMMRSLLRLRIVNLVGAAIFATYGVLIHAPPVWVVNGAIVLVDAWHLRSMVGGEEDLRVIEVATDSSYLASFLAFHADDIRRFVPEFAGLRDDHRAFLVLRDLVPAAAVLLRHTPDGELSADLDYAIPAYRDYTSGEYVYGDAQLFDAFDVSSVVSAPGNREHQRYLRRMGFRPDGERWRRPLG